MPGQAGQPKFQLGDAVVVRELPALFYTRTPEYVRGARGEIAEVAYESPAAEDESWDRPDAQPEWFYIVRSTSRSCGTATPGPTATPCKPRSPSVGCRQPARSGLRPASLIDALRQKDSHD
jgi:thiocyanate hydrolase subunit beta